MTFSCYGRRKLLNQDAAKRIVTAELERACKRSGASCVGFVVMPEHVHAIVGFQEAGQLSVFMQEWKRLGALRIGQLLRSQQNQVLGFLRDRKGRSHIWQRKYYDLLLFSEEKVLGKLRYMHGNPVSRALVDAPSEWVWSSARWYERGERVGVELARWDTPEVSGAEHTP